MYSAPEEKTSPFLNFATSFKRSLGLPILNSHFTLDSFPKISIASRRGGATAPAEYTLSSCFSGFINTVTRLLMSLMMLMFKTHTNCFRSLWKKWQMRDLTSLHILSKYGFLMQINV